MKEAVAVTCAFLDIGGVHLRKPDADIFRLALDLHTDYESTSSKLASHGLKSDG